MSRSVPLHRPAVDPNGSVEIAPDAPLRFGPRIRKQSGEHIAKSLSSESVVAEFRDAKAQPASFRARRWTLWIALGFGTSSLIAVAVVLLAPAFRPPSSNSVRSTSQQSELSLPKHQVAASLPSAPNERNQFSQKVLKVPHLRLEDSISFARPRVNDTFAWPPASPQLPFLSDAFERRRLRIFAFEHNAVAVNPASTSHEQHTELTRSVPGADADAQDPAFPASPSLPLSIAPRVLIRFAKESIQSRRRAEHLADALVKEGIEVADLEIATSPAQTALSFRYSPDEAAALRVGRLANVRPSRRSPTRNGLQLPPGLIEITFGR